MKQSVLISLALVVAACQAEPAGTPAPAKAAAAKNAPAKKEHITLDDYGYLRLGMLRTEAEEIMMTPGIERSSSQSDSTKMALYEWDLGVNGTVTLRFKEGKLAGKSQYGLR